MACAWNPHVAAVCQTVEQRYRRKKMLSWLQAMQLFSIKNGDSQRQREAVSTQIDGDKWNHERRPTVPLYLDELLGWKL